MSPSDPQLRAAVEHARGPVVALSRAPSPWASTAVLEDVRVDLDDGRTLHLVLKSGGRATRGERAVYRDVLAGAGLGTPVLVAGQDAWLLLDGVRGAPLWQSEGTGDWCATAAWLARAHARLAPTAAGRPAAAGCAWADQLARAVVREPRADGLRPAHGRAVAALDAAPRTLVHGELFPSNVLVHDGVPCVVDWETAGQGPGLLDLAALCVGWGPEEVARISSAYGGDLALLPAARLVVAVRWLGEPSAGSGAAGGHARRTDWWGEAQAAARTFS